jgi:hypothetical protein
MIRNIDSTITYFLGNFTCVIRRTAHHRQFGGNFKLEKKSQMNEENLKTYTFFSRAPQGPGPLDICRGCPPPLMGGPTT